MVVNIDAIGNTIGNFGKWQLRTILIIFLCKIPTSWFMAVIIFTGPEPKPNEYWCQPPIEFESINSEEWIKLAHPSIDHGHQKQIDNCHVYEDVYKDLGKYVNTVTGKIINYPSSNNTIVNCQKFQFHLEFSSLIQKFNLVCSRYLLLAVTQCFHIFGLLIGGIVAFFMLKKWSPRNVMLTGMVSQIFCGISTGLMSIYEFHVLFRCLSAASCALMYTSGQTIITDITGARPRIMTTIVFELFWSIGLILLPAVSIFTNSWSQLYIAISIPTMVLIFLHRIIPDSPRWLLRNGHYEEAKQIVIYGATVNKKYIPEDIDFQLKLQAAAMLEEPEPANWCSLWNRQPQRRYLFAVHYAWAVYILLFNSMVLNIRAWGVDHLHINTVVIGFSEMFGVFFGMYLILYTKRRWLWSGLLSVFAGGTAYFTWFIPDTLKENNIIALQMIPCIAIKLATSTALSILTNCTADLVTLEKRKILILSTSIWSRAWFVWAPLIYTLKRYVGPLVPLNIFAALAIIGGLLMSTVNEGHQKHHRRKTNVKETVIALR